MDAAHGSHLRSSILTFARDDAADRAAVRTLAIDLAVLTMWRLATCGLTGLGDAEAYDWVWSKFPSASYFDHPPGIAWLIHATTAIGGDTPLAVRLGPILL